MKVCKKCNIEKPLEFFHKVTTTQNNKKYQYEGTSCKDCLNAMKRNNLVKNKKSKVKTEWQTAIIEGILVKTATQKQLEFFEKEYSFIFK